MLVHCLLIGSAACKAFWTYFYFFAQRMVASFAPLEGLPIGTWFASEVCVSPL